MTTPKAERDPEERIPQIEALLADATDLEAVAALNAAEERLAELGFEVTPAQWHKRQDKMKP